MKRTILLILIFLLWSPVWAFDFDDEIYSSTASGGGADGVIGSITHTSSLNTYSGSIYYSTITASTAGVVRYGHIYTISAGDTVCIGLHTSDGTTLISGSGTSVANGWVNIDCGVNQDITLTDYILSVQVSGFPTTIGSYSDTVSQSVVGSYSCGAAATGGSIANSITRSVIFNNTPGSPE